MSPKMDQTLSLFHALERRYGSAPEGFVSTGIPDVAFYRTTAAVSRAPLLYEAGIVFVGQGHKVGHLDGNRFRYDASNYLVVCAPLPFDCETHASAEEPLLGLFVRLDVGELHEQVAALEALTELPPADPEFIQQSARPAPIDSTMRDALQRLLRIALDPVESRVLGRSAVNELMFRAIQGTNGEALRALTVNDYKFSRIARALETIHRDYAKPLRVEGLAKQAAMSISGFHRAFKGVSGRSPLQYLKEIRLQRARALIVGGERVSTAAHAVGYESPSQFSREFRRYFNAPPSEAASVAYSGLDFKSEAG